MWLGLLHPWLPWSGIWQSIPFCWFKIRHNCKPALNMKRLFKSSFMFWFVYRVSSPMYEFYLYQLMVYFSETNNIWHIISSVLNQHYRVNIIPDISKFDTVFATYSYQPIFKTLPSVKKKKVLNSVSLVLLCLLPFSRIALNIMNICT